MSECLNRRCYNFAIEDNSYSNRKSSNTEESLTKSAAYSECRAAVQTVGYPSSCFSCNRYWFLIKTVLIEGTLKRLFPYATCPPFIIISLPILARHSRRDLCPLRYDKTSTRLTWQMSCTKISLMPREQAQVMLERKFQLLAAACPLSSWP